MIYKCKELYSTFKDYVRTTVPEYVPPYFLKDAIYDAHGVTIPKVKATASSKCSSKINVSVAVAVSVKKATPISAAFKGQERFAEILQIHRMCSKR